MVSFSVSLDGSTSPVSTSPYSSPRIDQLETSINELQHDLREHAQTFYVYVFNLFSFRGGLNILLYVYVFNLFSFRGGLNILLPKIRVGQSRLPLCFENQLKQYNFSNDDDRLLPLLPALLAIWQYYITEF